MYLESTDEQVVDVEGDGTVHEVHDTHTLNEEELVPTEDDRLIRHLGTRRVFQISGRGDTLERVFS